MKKHKSLNEEKPKDPYEEKAKIITKGDKKFSTNRRRRPLVGLTTTSREEVKQQNALNHYKNLREYYK